MNHYELFDPVRRGPDNPPPPLPTLPPTPGPSRFRRWWRWTVRIAALLLLLFFAAVVWLAFTAPLSKSLQPPTPPSITLLASDGTPFARRGATIGAPVDAARLPDHVREAFIAIEDRRFYHHWGIDPRGIARAILHNSFSSDRSQGASTITQQLAKNAFLSSSRTMGRKFQEMLIAFWLEAWLSKNEILSRYLSNVYFGDNVYGLRAAARHYFSRDPEDLTIGQAAMLAGLVKAPSKLAPTGNLDGAQKRQAVVVQAMVEAGYLTPTEAAQVEPARLRLDPGEDDLPNGTYFADWVLPQARDRAGEIRNEQTVQTTLDLRIQRAAERAIRTSGLKKAQVALVAMRPDGRVVAMVGGRSYDASPFNRATQARRQPGSTFKLFVYLAALRAGMTPDSTVENEPIKIGHWEPKNADGKYGGTLTLRDAFARSSNVAAARLIQKVGPAAVIKAARDLGISTPIPNEASIALGTSTVSLLELTAAYAAVANGAAPVRPHGLPDPEVSKSWWSMLTRPFAHKSTTPLGDAELDGLRDLLATTIQRGTATGAALSIPAYGKTGTTQDSRDVLFVGYAGDLVVGVWVGNDDNSPNPGLRSSLPARIWRDFMIAALGVTPPPRPAPPPTPEDEGGTLDQLINGVDVQVDSGGMDVTGNIVGRGFNLRVGRDGSIRTTIPDPADEQEPEPQR